VRKYAQCWYLRRADLLNVSKRLHYRRGHQGARSGLDFREKFIKRLYFAYILSDVIERNLWSIRNSHANLRASLHSLLAAASREINFSRKLKNPSVIRRSFGMSFGARMTHEKYRLSALSSTRFVAVGVNRLPAYRFQADTDPDTRPPRDTNVATFLFLGTHTHSARRSGGGGKRERDIYEGNERQKGKTSPSSSSLSLSSWSSWSPLLL